MLRAAVVVVLLSSAGLAQAQDSIQCGALVAPQAMSAQPTVIAPVFAGFGAPRHQLGAPTGVLDQAFGESLTVDQVLFRRQVERCGVVASVTPAAQPVSPPLVDTGAAVDVAAPVATVVPATATTEMPTAADPAAYKPRTEFDNTPWRFNMNQNGEQMTADAFAAWMKSKGVRVAKGAAPKPVVAVPVSASAGTTAPGMATSEVADAGAGTTEAAVVEAPVVDAPVTEATPVDSSVSPVEAPTEVTEPDEEG